MELDTPARSVLLLLISQMPECTFETLFGKDAPGNPWSRYGCVLDVPLYSCVIIRALPRSLAHTRAKRDVEGELLLIGSCFPKRLRSAAGE